MSDPLEDPGSVEALGTAAAPSAEVHRVTNRAGLDHQTVVAAAVEIIDEVGLKALTMRAIGARLGVEAMALYRHVHGRDGLMDAVVERVIDDLYGDPSVHLSATHWQDYLVRLAHGVRRIALAHPQVFPLIATRPPAAPWVRPPLRSLRWMESFLQTLKDCHFSDAAAVAAYRAFSSFLLGHLLLEVSAQGVDVGPVDEEDPGPPDVWDLAGYPLLQRLEPELSQDHAAAEFDEALESLLERLDRAVFPNGVPAEDRWHDTD